ncbi:DinB family protein [Pontibacter korlensis]
MVDIIHHRESIFEQLRKLDADKKPEFGVMTPQHMVEHLAYVVRFSNGKLPQKLHYRDEKAEKFKQYTIYTDRELMPGFKAPMLGDEPARLVHTDINAALANLHQELEDFDAFFANMPDAKPVSPTLGELDYKEWVIFHNKHFKHHLKQFGLA